MNRIVEAIVETPRYPNASRRATALPRIEEEKPGILSNRVNLTITNNSNNDPGAWDDIT
jgi:hypothetical protein